KVDQHDRVRTLAAVAAGSQPPLLGLAKPGARIRTNQQESLARLISGTLAGWGRVNAGDLGPGVCGDRDQPKDEQKQQNQQHAEELPNRMSLLWAPRPLRRRRPAWSPRSARRARRGAAQM